MTRIREDQMGLLRQALAELGEPNDGKFAAISQRNLAQLLAGHEALLALQSIVVRYLRPGGGDATGDWRPLKDAPRNSEPIAVLTAQGAVVKAFWGADVEGEKGPCVAWAACDENQHPPSWTDGVCWSVNEDGVASDPPILWCPLGALPATAALGDIIATLEAAGYGAFGAGERGDG